MTTKQLGGERCLAFTLVELLVVIAIIGLLAGLLLPVLARGKDKARDLECLSHLRQLGTAVYLYADEHNHRLPAAERRPTTPVFSTNALPRICDLLTNYVGGALKVFSCPKDTTGYFGQEGSSYEWNYTFNNQPIEQLLFPGGTLSTEEAPLMYDYDNVHKSSKGDTKNALFADGHVDRL